MALRSVPTNEQVQSVELGKVLLEQHGDAVDLLTSGGGGTPHGEAPAGLVALDHGGNQFLPQGAEGLEIAEPQRLVDRHRFDDARGDVGVLGLADLLDHRRNGVDAVVPGDGRQTGGDEIALVLPEDDGRPFKKEGAQELEVLALQLGRRCRGDGGHATARRTGRDRRTGRVETPARANHRGPTGAGRVTTRADAGAAGGVGELWAWSQGAAATIRSGVSAAIGRSAATGWSVRSLIMRIALLPSTTRTRNAPPPCVGLRPSTAVSDGWVRPVVATPWSTSGFPPDRLDDPLPISTALGGILSKARAGQPNGATTSSRPQQLVRIGFSSGLTVPIQTGSTSRHGPSVRPRLWTSRKGLRQS